jgi:hypothetical protein
LIFLTPTEKALVKVTAPEEPKSTLTVANGHWIIVPPDSMLLEENGV